ncbi:MAG: Omp28-related outer membrane protein [Alloprevotella sp.]
MNLTDILKHAVAALLLSMTLTAQAQEGAAYVSYVDDQVSATSTLGMPSAGQFSVAAHIDADLVEYYENLRVKGIRFALTSLININSVTVWVRKTLDGDDLFTAQLVKGTDPFVKGWNVVQSEPSEVIDGPFFIGYTIDQRGGCYAVATADAARDGGLYTNDGSGWVDRSAEGHGQLGMGVYIEADNLTSYDLSLDSISLGATLLGADLDIPLVAWVKNVGSQSVEGYTITCTTDALKPIDWQVSRTLFPGEQTVDTLIYHVPYEERHKNVRLTVALSPQPECTDENMENNVCTTMFDVSRFDFTKRGFVEEFTTEACSNCPRAAAMLAESMELPQYAGRILALCHHAGYYTDWLTQTADQSYLWFYNSGYNTYAPGFMFDRDAGSASSPVFSCPTDGFAGRFDQMLAKEALVGMKVTAKYNTETQKADVLVEGERKTEAASEPMMITVYLTEDRIPSKQQAGASGGYEHQHVMRSYSSVWGDSIEWDYDECFSFSTSLSTKDVTDFDNVEVLAIVHRYNAAVPSDCAIYNAAVAHSVDWSGAAAISQPVSCIEEMQEIYTIDGRRCVRADRPGIYLVHYRDSKGGFVTRKELR